MNRMSKMVSFRLSIEDFEQFKDRCETVNARSISEMARDAVHHYLEHGPPVTGGSLHQKVIALESKIEALEAKLARMSRLVSPQVERGGDHGS